MREEGGPLLGLQAEGITRIEIGQLRVNDTAVCFASTGPISKVSLGRAPMVMIVRPVTFVSLFAGIGGFDLGLERAGMKCIAQVECNDYCRKILARHWPRVPKYRDVRTFKRTTIRRRPDAIVGGFPCQDISSAGQKVGITGSRSGLWKEMLRIIRAFRPPFAIVENVSALRSRGLDVVLSDLAQAGYDAEWDCIPAAAVGAPHRRDRIFVVAHAKRLGWGADHSILGSVPPGQSGAWASLVSGRTLRPSV